MRNYVSKSNQGGLPDSLTATKLGAGETNSFLNELENSVTYSGQTLAPSDGTGEVATQLAQSLFLHGVKSSGFQDSGSANTYEITPISGSSGVRIPSSYANMDGATVWFIPANASTTDSTLNVGQTSGTLLGAKKLLNNDGSAITTEITTDGPFEVRYDSSADGGSGAWLLQPWAGNVGIQPATEAETLALSLDTVAITPLRLGQSFTNFAIGYGQSWSDVTASRALSTVYTNTEDAPIMVHINVTGDTANGRGIDVEIDGVVMIEGRSQGSGYGPSVEFIVPPGSTYEAIGEFTGTLTQWSELR